MLQKYIDLYDWVDFVEDAKKTSFAASNEVLNITPPSSPRALRFIAYLKQLGSSSKNMRVESNITVAAMHVSFFLEAPDGKGSLLDMPDDELQFSHW